MTYESNDNCRYGLRGHGGLLAQNKYTDSLIVLYLPSAHSSADTFLRGEGPAAIIDSAESIDVGQRFLSLSAGAHP